MKLPLGLASIVSLFTLFIPVQAGCVAHWKLDETSGTSTADSAGGDNTGTLSGTPTWVSSGTIASGALDFNGSDNRVAAPLTGIPTGNNARTISIWFNADTVNTTGMKIFGYGDGSGTTGGGGNDPDPLGDSFVFTVEDNGLVYFRYSGGNRRFNLAGNSNLSANTWYHLAAVVPDGATTTDDVLVYLNGVAANQTLGGTTQTLNTDPSPSAPGFYLGHDGLGTTYFDGTLDDAQVYDTALGGTEIASLHDNPGSTIADNVAPLITGYNPTPGASGIDPGANLVATFGEGIMLVDGGTITLRNLGDVSGSSDVIITLPDSRVSTGDFTLNFNPSADLAAATTYAIRISGAAVKDQAGNFFLGIGDDSTWYFTTGTEPPPTPPNVLFVVFDDLNTWVKPMGEYPDVQTPNMDRLAARGVTFRQAHCQAPICGPSRVSFLSGLRPSTTGKYALNSLLYNDATYGAGSHKAIHRFYKDAGYTTASVGKIYHQAVEFGSSLDYGDGVHDYGPLPTNKLTGTAVSGSNRLVDWGVYPPTDGETRDYKSATWALDRIQNFAANPVKPFFLSVGIVRPHLPLFVPQHWFDLYPMSPTRSFARPFYEPDDLDDTPRFARYTHWDILAPRTETLIQYNQWDAHTRAYLACVTYADAMFGRLLDGLEDPNGDGNTSDSIADNTIVVMFSDHGYHLGEKGLTSKCTLWERSTRVPLIIAGPGLATGEICKQPAELLDLYPTLLDLCGIGPYAPLEGISLRPQLENPASAPARRPAVITHGPDNHAVVDARYRYIRYADGSEELYDHAIDPDEETNRINDPNFREVAVRLAASIPAVSAPYQAGETSRLLSIEAGNVVHWDGDPITDPEAASNPVVATFVSPVADEVPIDEDNDLMPDWWEIHYTGSIGILKADGNKDGDPVPDADEYLHGTDPTDPLSFLQARIEPNAPESSVVTHSTVPGRDYRFEFSPNLSDWGADGVSASGSGSDVTRSIGSFGLPSDKGFLRVEVRQGQ